MLAFLNTGIGWAQRTKTNFGADWQFRRENTDWEKVTLPHTARVEKLVVIDQYQGVFEYRKTFRAPVSANQDVSLYFEGVMMEADVYLNGRKIASHKGGYLPFSVNLTNLLQPNQDNTISLKVTNVDNPEIPPGKPLKELDFNYYGGIYRNAYLVVTDKLHLTDAVAANEKASGGWFVHFANADDKSASGTIKTHLQNGYAATKNVQIRTTLTDSDGKKFQFLSTQSTINGHASTEITTQISIPNPKLWSPKNPNLYTLQIELLSDGKVIDVQLSRIGIRTAKLQPDGFYLNGQKTFLSGTNRHQEYPYLGYAISDEAQYRDAVKIKSAGFDFVRLSHYPHAEAFLDACDELGLIVMNSLPGWQFFGNANFEANALQNLRDMVRRDRNHASILFWENSLNETGMSDAFMKEANVVLEEEFPYPTISASWIDNDGYDLFIPARQHGKAPDYWNHYEKGNRKILIAEYGDWEYYAQNAGFNQKEFANLKEEERTSRQLRAFGEKRLLQQAFNYQEAANSNRKGKNTIGEANWLMFDYNRGYSPDIESSGISDIFRIPKFAFFFYQSQRAPEKLSDQRITSGPMVSIASYWNEKSPTDLTVYSNCEEVALYLDDKLIGRKKTETNATNDQLPHPPLVFPIGKFTPGTLRAEGFIGGKKVAESVVKSPQNAVQILLSYDTSGIPISKHNPDVVFAYAKITDANGTLVPDATNEVTFSITGNAAIIGTAKINAEAGIATIVVRTQNLNEKISVTAVATGLKGATATLK